MPRAAHCGRSLGRVQGARAPPQPSLPTGRQADGGTTSIGYRVPALPGASSPETGSSASSGALRPPPSRATSSTDLFCTEDGTVQLASSGASGFGKSACGPRQSHASRAVRASAILILPPVARAGIQAQDPRDRAVRVARPSRLGALVRPVAHQFPGSCLSFREAASAAPGRAGAPLCAVRVVPTDLRSSPTASPRLTPQMTCRAGWRPPPKPEQYARLGDTGDRTGSPT